MSSDLLAPLWVVLRNRDEREKTHPNTQSVTENTENNTIRVKYRIGDEIVEVTYDALEWRVVEARMQEFQQ